MDIDWSVCFVCLAPTDVGPSTNLAEPEEPALPIRPLSSSISGARLMGNGPWGAALLRGPFLRWFQGKPHGHRGIFPIFREPQLPEFQSRARKGLDSWQWKTSKALFHALPSTTLDLLFKRVA